MVGYWDTSAIVPLLVTEPDTPARSAQLKDATGLATWWGTRIECVSALARRERECALTGADVTAALARLDTLARQWLTVLPSETVRARAERLLRVHPLRAADALHLAAALRFADEQPRGIRFFAADLRLRDAADREGFTVG